MSKKRRSKKEQDALALAKRNAKLLRQGREPQMNIGAVVSGTLNTTPSVTHVTLTATPALTGYSAMLKSIRVQGYIKSASAALENYRFDVILDRDPTPGTIATAGQLYTDSGSISSPMRHDTKNRFKLLRTVKGWVHNGDSKGGVFFDLYKKLNLKIECKTAATYSQAEQTRNAILIVHQTDATGSQPEYQYFVTQVLLDTD